MRMVLVALIAAFAVSTSPALAQEAVPERPDREADLVLTVEGFHCAACSAKLEKRLSKIEGAHAVEAAKWEEGTISIWLKDDVELEDEVLADAVKESGFVLKKVHRAKVEPAPAS
jgi:copper chaperone CopZ